MYPNEPVYVPLSPMTSANSEPDPELTHQAENPEELPPYTELLKSNSGRSDMNPLSQLIEKESLMEYKNYIQRSCLKEDPISFPEFIDDGQEEYIEHVTAGKFMKGEKKKLFLLDSCPTIPLKKLVHLLTKNFEDPQACFLIKSAYLKPEQYAPGCQRLLISFGSLDFQEQSLAWEYVTSQVDQFSYRGLKTLDFVFSNFKKLDFAYQRKKIEDEKEKEKEKLTEDIQIKPKFKPTSRTFILKSLK